MPIRDYTTILITGASAGLGRELAIQYARPGRVLALAARRADRLTDCAAACRARGATVISAALDVTDIAYLRTWTALVEETAPIDLAIVNAGVFDGLAAGQDSEPSDVAARLIETNLTGAIATVDAVLPGMRTRQRGHVALIASLAAVLPAADAPSYSASKAGLAGLWRGASRTADGGSHHSDRGSTRTHRDGADSDPSGAGCQGSYRSDRAARLLRRGLARRTHADRLSHPHSLAGADRPGATLAAPRSGESPLPLSRALGRTRPGAGREAMRVARRVVPRRKSARPLSTRCAPTVFW